MLLCLLTLAAAPTWAHAQAPNEYHVKAAFLYNFAKFVEWPSDPPNEPIVIGIIGKDPFGGALEEAIRGKTVKGRKLAAQHLKAGQDPRGCQIIFISASEQKRLRSILADLNGAGVLTVGDTEGFAEAGGMINLTIVDQRVHFEINPDAAQRAGMKISSKLLSLAKIVKVAEGPGNH
jgi:hypothetical protein